MKALLVVLALALAGCSDTLYVETSEKRIDANGDAPACLTVMRNLAGPLTVAATEGTYCRRVSS